MENFLNGLTLLGIPAVVLVPVIVQGMKSVGLPERWAGPSALAIGLAVAGLAEVVQAWPEVTPFARFAVAGLLLGFASVGTYSQYRFHSAGDQGLGVPDPRSLVLLKERKEHGRDK